MFQRRADTSYDTASAKNDFLFLDVGDEPDVDLYIISLRGESILCEVLNRIKKSQSISNLPNTANLAGNTYHFSHRKDDILKPDDAIIDWQSLPDKIFETRVIPMQASNGCPYQCAFCNFSKDRRLSFVKPIDWLMNELRAVTNRGVRYVWFVDDNFRFGKNDLNTVCQRIVDEGIVIKWMSFMRASTLRNVDMQLLRQSGCMEVQLGLESADEKILINMNKKADPGLYSEVLYNALSAGINCSCYFIYGFPGETDKTALKTREFIKRHEFPEFDGYLSWSIYPFVLSPLSPIYEHDLRGKYNLTGYMQKWKHRTMDSDQAIEQVLKTYYELQNSGPIYRGDNQDILNALGPQGRKKFEAMRHKLSKAALTGQLEGQEIIQSFCKMFPQTNNL
jgi:p-methyltransferase